MIIAPGFIGIDVSKDYLDIFDGTAQRIANTPAAIAAFVVGLASPRLVLFEATGRYDRRLQEGLAAAGLSFARVNPLHARAFARATGRLAKTDAIDARLLAAMAQALTPTPQPPADLERQAILGAIRTLKGDKLRAAKLLGIGKTTLYRKLKEYGIDDPMREE